MTEPQAVAGSVTFALIDATAQPSPACPAASRYVTPIANVPLICHVFDELVENGIERARIVAAPEVSGELRRVLDGGRSWGIEISHVETPVLNGRHTVLEELERAAAREAVLLHPGDCLLGVQLAEMQTRYRTEPVACVLLEQALKGPHGGDRRRLADWALVLSPAARPLLSSLLASGDDGDLVAALAEGGCRVGVCAGRHQWRYEDATEVLLTANRMMLEGLPVPAAEAGFGEGNEVHGRVAIHPTARVSASVLHGPVAIDAGAVVEDSFIGPYTSVGPGVVLIGTEIDNSMVLTGAEIRHPGFRVEASIIGERAAVIRSFALPRGLHMRLRPDSRVTFS